VTEHAQAVPLARKKRRRPPPRALVLAAGMVVWCAAWLVFDFMHVTDGGRAVIWSPAIALTSAAMAYWWPVFRREYRVWKDSE
jgi:hypothetical protein